jgi:ketosteroid isomerase-like protein
MTYASFACRIVLNLSLWAGIGFLSIAAQAADPRGRSLLGLREPANDGSGLSDIDRIRETISLYGRASDAGDVEAFRKIFTPNVLTENFRRMPDGSIVRSKTPVGHSVEVMTQGLAKVGKARGDSKVHHFTHDPIIEIHGDTAYINVQFLATRSRANDVVLENVEGVQGTVQTTLTGYYDDVLKKIDGRWLIVEHHVIIDIPYELPK